MKIRTILTSLALLALAAAPARATWEFANETTASSKDPEITDGNWTLYLYSKSKVKYKSHAGGSTVLDLSGVQTDTGLTITMLDNEAFKGNTVITELICPPTCTTFWTKSFNSCKTIQKIGIPSDFTTFNGDNMFDSATALKTIYILGTTPEEGTVALPATVKTLNSLTFAGCTSIEKVVAPGVVDVGNRTFAGMTSLEQVVLSPNLEWLRTNGTTWNHSAFYNGTADAKLVDFYPTVFPAGFHMVDPSNSKACEGMFAYTQITNYFDFSACTFTEIPPHAFRNTQLAGATLPATLATIGQQAFWCLCNSATFRFLGDQPTVTKTDNNAPFRNWNAAHNSHSANQIGFRHTFVVDADTYPAWTNDTKFISMADVANNNTLKTLYTRESSDFPTPDYPEETLGVTSWGDNGAYAWLVQYVDHSTVTATWMNGSQTFSLTYADVGDAPTTPATTPTKASTDEFDYTFIGWNTDPDATTALDLSQISMSADMTFHAIYSAATRSYEIAWKLDADTLIDTTTVAYGATPTHADASKASDENYSYTFDGWSTDGSTVLASIPAVTGPATYIAVFSRHALDTTVTISWLEENGATPLDPASTTVEKGTRPTHAEPTKDPDVGTVYTFDGWILVGDPNSTVIPSAELPLATVDCTYKAHFAASTRRYTVTFADWDGSVLTTKAYDYGTPAADVAVPADPVRATTAEYSYTYAGWDSEITQVSGDATYTATYTATPNEYSATFVDGIDDSVIAGPTTYAYGATVTAPAAPEHYGFTFSAWSPEVGTMPAANTTYTATYTTNSYTITFVNGDATTTASYPYLTAAADIVFPTPAKTSTSKASYSFLEWSPAAAQVTADATYTAVFTANVLSPMSIAYGGTTMGADGLSASIAATLSNYMAGDGTFDASVSADVLNTQATVIDTVDGTATVSAPNASASFSGLVSGRAYDWTLSATQNFASSIGSDTAAVHGRFYAKPTSSWFSGAAFADGAYQPANASAAGQQLRLNLTLDVPEMLPRVLPNASGAVVGIAPCQANAGSAPRFHAWNGAQWIALDGYDVTGGSTIALHGVIDFAISGGTMTWYADGQELTDANGNWAIPLSTSAKSLTRFAYTGDDADITSFSGNYDQGSVATVLLIY